MKNRQKVEDIDKQLSMLHAEVRQSKNREPKTNDNSQSVQTQVSRTAEKQEEIRRYNEAEENCSEALEKLISMEM